jgi:hypothetical protein
MAEPKESIFATIDSKLRRQLKHRLMDENIHYKDWLEKRIAEYLSKPKGKQRTAGKAV